MDRQRFPCPEGAGNAMDAPHDVSPSSPLLGIRYVEITRPPQPSRRRTPTRAPPAAPSPDLLMNSDDPMNSPQTITMFLDASMSDSVDLSFDSLQNSFSSLPDSSLWGGISQNRIRLRPRTRSLDSMFPGLWETTDHIPERSLRMDQARRELNAFLEWRNGHINLGSDPSQPTSDTLHFDRILMPDI